MDKILYWLIGVAVAVALAASTLDPKVRPPIEFNRLGILSSIIFFLTLAAGFLFLTRTIFGGRLRAWIDKRFHDEEDRERTTPGKVRKPSWWWLP